MKKLVILLVTGLLVVGSTGAGIAGHDNGKGKSQDGNSAGNNAATGIGNDGNGGVAPGQSAKDGVDVNGDGKANGKDGAPGQNK